MKKLSLRSIVLVCLLLLLVSSTSYGQTVVCAPGLMPDVSIPGFTPPNGKQCFVVEAVGQSITRDIDTSQGGINIGIGTIEEIFSSSAYSKNSTLLQQFAVSGNNLSEVLILFLEPQGSGVRTFLEIRLRSAFVKSLAIASTSDANVGTRPQMDFSLLFEKIRYYYTPLGSSPTEFCWNLVLNTSSCS